MFHNDLKEASRIEEAIKVYFERKGITAELNPRKNADYDLKVGDSLIEVKLDCEQFWTDNVCVEKKCLGETKADSFIYVFLAPYIIPTSTLKWLYPDSPKKKLGDQNHEAALIPVEHFIKFSRHL